MERKAIEEKVIECVEISFKKTGITVDTNFKDDLGGASILMVGLASLIENELDVLIPLPTIAACPTVKDVVDKVEEEINEA